jgi:indolepyruvate ferredoxin oxidoreductase
MLDNYELIDRYRRESGRVLLTGTQALVRIPLMQRTADMAAGLNTAGFISGYRGSPLGMVDQELWRAHRFLEESNIEFLPAVNEDLAATAILGSQQVETDPGKTVDGVFGMWYGKGPGVDRAGDALKHGNAYGSSPTGGVLVVAGDDHGCISSSMPHQSDVAFLTFMMPHLNPASVAEYLEYGLYGIALSRFSGMWVGFKAITETVESAMSVELPAYRQFVNPPGYVAPATGLHYRWPDFPGPQIEERLEAKKAATLAFVAANPIDRKIFDVPDARFGIVTTGKAHLDLLEALRMLGIDAAEARRIGIDVYKVGMVWPLEPTGALDFVQRKNEDGKTRSSSSKKNAASSKASSRNTSTTTRAKSRNGWSASRTKKVNASYRGSANSPRYSSPPSSRVDWTGNLVANGSHVLRKSWPHSAVRK